MYREVFCRLGSTLGPGFITMKPKISRFVINKGSRQGKVRSQNLDEACLKRRYHTGKAAIENANTIEERRLKIVRNKFSGCHSTNGNRKHCFYRFFIRVRRLLIAFSIAAYTVWLNCIPFRNHDPRISAKSPLTKTCGDICQSKVLTKKVTIVTV